METPSLAPGFPGRCSVVPCNGWQTQLILGLFPTPLFQNLCQEAPRLCPHLNQRLKSHNPLNGSRPALHTHCCLEGHQKPTAASVPLPRRPHQTCSTTSPCQAAGGAGHAWHLIFLNKNQHPALLTPNPGLGMAAVVGSCPWAHQGPAGDTCLPLCIQRGEWVCR